VQHVDPAAYAALVVNVTDVLFSVDPTAFAYVQVRATRVGDARPLA
jgi:hypothetical protein